MANKNYYTEITCSYRTSGQVCDVCEFNHTFVKTEGIANIPTKTDVQGRSNLPHTPCVGTVVTYCEVPDNWDN